MLNEIRQNPRITTTELALKFTVSKGTIVRVRDIEKLKQGHIQRDSSERDGLWIIINQGSSK